MYADDTLVSRMEGKFGELTRFKHLAKEGLVN